MGSQEPAGQGWGSLKGAEKGRESERELNSGVSRDPGVCDHRNNELPGSCGVLGPFCAAGGLTRLDKVTYWGNSYKFLKLCF